MFALQDMLEADKKFRHRENKLKAFMKLHHIVTACLKLMLHNPNTHAGLSPGPHDSVAPAVEGKPELLQQPGEVRLGLGEQVLGFQEPAVIVLSPYGPCCKCYLMASCMTVELVTSCRKASSSCVSARLTVSRTVVSTWIQRLVHLPGSSARGSPRSSRTWPSASCRAAASGRSGPA